MPFYASYDGVSWFPANYVRTDDAPPISAPHPVGAKPAIGPCYPRLVNASELLVTSGAINPTDRGFDISAAITRATLRTTGDRLASLSFVYGGQVADPAPFASGEIRHQVALKLKARDGCNVVYAVWRITNGGAEPEFRVQVKSNPTMTESSQCGNAGYTSYTGSYQVPPPAAILGQRYALSAGISDDDDLYVTFDGSLVWWGHIPGLSALDDGPVGLRTDNVIIAECSFAAA